MRRIEELAKGGIAAVPQAPASGSGEGGEGSAPSPMAAPAASASGDWAALVDVIDAAGHLRVAQIMRDRVRVIELGPDRLVYQPADNFPEDPAPDMREALFKVTGRRWQIERGNGEAQPSLREAAEAKARARDERIRCDPLVKAALDAFPDAEILEPHSAQAAGGRPRR